MKRSEYIAGILELVKETARIHGWDPLRLKRELNFYREVSAPKDWRRCGWYLRKLDAEDFFRQQK